jgi:hypothetical protein
MYADMRSEFIPSKVLFNFDGLPEHLADDFFWYLVDDHSIKEHRELTWNTNLHGYKSLSWCPTAMMSKIYVFLIKFIMVLFEDFLDEAVYDDANFKKDTLYEFYRLPTPDNAEKMLIALEIHVPYGTLLRTRRKRTQHTLTRPKKLRMRGGVLSNISDANALNILRRADFLHDVHIGKSIPDAMIDVVLKNAPLTISQRSWLVDLCRKRNKPSVEFTAIVGKNLEKMMGLKRSKTKLPTIKADKALYGRVTEWMQQPSLEVVIDGLFEAPKRNANMTTSEARGLCLYAFFMLLFGKAPDVPAPLPSGTLAISVLTGTFHDMDVGHCGFLSRWIYEFNRSIGCAKVTVLNVGNVPQPYDANVRVDPSHVVLVRNSINVPFTNPRITVPPIMGRSADYTTMANDEANLYMRYPKSHLQYLQTSFVALPPHEQLHFHPFIQRLVRVNALRDEYKADVALQRDAVFLTLDRLAHMYYSVRARKLKLRDQGVYYSVSGMGDAELIV